MKLSIKSLKPQKSFLIICLAIACIAIAALATMTNLTNVVYGYYTTKPSSPFFLVMNRIALTVYFFYFTHFLSLNYTKRIKQKFTNNCSIIEVCDVMDDIIRVSMISFFVFAATLIIATIFQYIVLNTNPLVIGEHFLPAAWFYGLIVMATDQLVCLLVIFISCVEWRKALKYK